MKKRFLGNKVVATVMVAALAMGTVIIGCGAEKDNNSDTSAKNSSSDQDYMGIPITTDDVGVNGRRG